VIRPCARGLVAVIGSIAAAASPAAAHGFGQRYDLPIPLAYYLWGAGATVVLSFAVFASFLTPDWAVRSAPVLHLRLPGWGRSLVCVAAQVARAAAAMVFLTVVLAGFFGDQNPFRNIAPTMIWIVAWVGISFLSSAVGDVWRLVNPWDTLYRPIEWVHGRLRPGRSLSLRAYPHWLGVWPAFSLFVMFAWMELVWNGRSVPAELAGALAIYSAVTWAAMFCFGRETWLRHGEAFTLVFGIFARFAPFAWPRDATGQLEIRLPASGLIEDAPLHPSMVTLVIAVLATVTFDGFLETPVWARLDAAILDAPLDSPLWTVLDLREDQALRLARTLALPAAIAVFVAGYLAVCGCMSALSADKSLTTGILAQRFVLTLVPISLAYHVAHYFSYLFVGGQYAIPLVSDPFGWGWNLFATASYQVDIGLIGPRLQWYVAVVAVVLGHIIAVALSHIVALRIFPKTGSALATQAPMLALMVAYTMVSLWILSQPITESPVG
jgi:hypothetical protein